MDPQQEQIMHTMMALIPIVIGIGLLFFAFFIFLFWRIFTKAGMSGWLSLLILFPGIGQLVALCVLAFGDWRVVPIPTAAPYYPPPPPPPPAFQPPPQA